MITGSPTPRTSKKKSKNRVVYEVPFSPKNESVPTRPSFHSSKIVLSSHTTLIEETSLHASPKLSMNSDRLNTVPDGICTRSSGTKVRTLSPIDLNTSQLKPSTSVAITNNSNCAVTPSISHTATSGALSQVLFKEERSNSAYSNQYDEYLSSWKKIRSK